MKSQSAKAVPARALQRDEKLENRPVIAMITIMEPQHYPIVEDQYESQTYGQIIDGLLSERPNATSVTLDLDRSKF